MRTLEAAGFRFVDLRHSRTPNGIEWFQTEVQTLDGRALNLYPNQAHPHLYAPNTLTLGFFGVPEGFQQHLWTAAVQRAKRAQVCQLENVSIKSLTDQMINRLEKAERDIYDGVFSKPIDLLAFSRTRAIEELTGDQPIDVPNRPIGTSVVITGGGGSFGRRWSLSGGSTTETNDSTVFAGATSGGGTVLRGGVKFTLPTLSSPTVNDSILGVQVYNVVGTPNAIDVYGYDTPSGDGDPMNGDSAATKYGKADDGTKYIDDFDWSSTGFKTRDLGTTADTDIAANFASPGTFAFGFRATNEAPGSDTYAGITWVSVSQTLTLDLTTAMTPRAMYNYRRRRTGF